jgi:hypothetical protein
MKNHKFYWWILLRILYELSVVGELEVHKVINLHP